MTQTIGYRHFDKRKIYMLQENKKWSFQWTKEKMCASEYM